MKYYRCDSCKKDFNPDKGMIKGWYSDNNTTTWSASDDSEYDIEVRKTIKLYRKVAASVNFAAHEVEVELDLCPACVKGVVKV